MTENIVRIDESDRASQSVFQALLDRVRVRESATDPSTRAWLDKEIDELWRVLDPEAR